MLVLLEIVIKNYFHTFENKCFYDIKHTNIGKIEIVSLTYADKSMKLCETNQKLKNARQKGFSFNQINKLTIIFSSNLRKTNIR